MDTSTPTGRARPSLAAEALGYAGGALVLVGVTLVAARTWESLGSGGRVGLTAVTGLVAGAAAWRIPDGEDGFRSRQRLRATLWLVAAVALALAGGVTVHDVLDARSPEAVVLGGAAVGTAVSAAVWRGRRRPVQQAVTLLGVAIVAGTLGGHVEAPGYAGLFAALVGAGALVAGLRHLTHPSTVAVWCGGAVLLVSCLLIGGQWQSAGLLIAVTVATTLVGLAVWPEPVHDRHHVVACAVTGGVLLISTLPAAIGYHAEQAGVVTGVVVWLASVALLWVAAPRHALRAPVPVWLLAGVLYAIGPQVVSTQWRTPGVVAGVVVAAIAVGIGVATTSIPLTLVGAFGLAVSVPRAVLVLVPGELAAPLAIVLVGLVIVAVALWLVRRRQVTREDSAASTPSSRAPGVVG